MAKPPKPLPPVEYLRECFIYDSADGLLLWKHRPREHFCNDRVWHAWLTLHAGTVAGSAHADGRITMLLRPFGNYSAHRIAWKLATGEEPLAILDNPKRCRICGTEFSPRGHNARCCSDDCRREAQRQYNASPEGREAQRQYRASPKGREKGRQYAASPKARAKRRQYAASLKGSEQRRQYNRDQYDRQMAALTALVEMGLTLPPGPKSYHARSGLRALRKLYNESTQALRELGIDLNQVVADQGIDFNRPEENADD